MTAVNNTDIFSLSLKTLGMDTFPSQGEPATANQDKLVVPRRWRYGIRANEMSSNQRLSLSCVFRHHAKVKRDNSAFQRVAALLSYIFTSSVVACLKLIMSLKNLPAVF